MTGDYYVKIVMPPCEIQTSISRGDPASILPESHAGPDPASILPESHAGRDPASMRFYRRRTDSRVKHGNDKKERHGVTGVG
ncbi:MAG: hypothetical protein ISR54_07370 [Chlorobium phaeobacteroides]|uniref:Uncharacterized protein n=1 Tax=Chlorobium phaeobacteroides (strain BS1) TaxID=331678 RepID=B3EMF7_CHLPB|nr:hypothetical protein [Chlorobium phaeobacteroides]